MTAEEALVSEILDKREIESEIQRKFGRNRNYKPYITISREPGSGGRPVADLLAKKMGYKVYDKELLNQVAMKLKKSVKLIKRVDEKSRSGMMDLIQNMLNPDYISDERYFRILYQTVLEIVQKGGAVLVGRGCNFIAPKSYGLQVQIVAPYRVRVSRAIQYEHIKYQEARDVIREVSADRERFVRQYFGKDIHAPKYYDLTVNTTFYTLEQVVDIIHSAFVAKFPETTLRLTASQT